MKMRIAGAEVVVGAFVLLGVLGFLGLYIASGGYEGLGRNWVTLRCSFGNASGVAAGTEVRMNGIEIGLVKTVALDAAGRVEVVMFLDRNHAAFVRQSAAARQVVAFGRDPTPPEIDALRAEGSSMVSIEAGVLSTGGSTLVISQGQAMLPELGPGEALVGTPPTSIWSAIAGLTESLGEMTGRGRERPGGSVAAVFQDNGRMYEQASAALARVDGTIQHLDATVTALRDDAHNSVEELRGLLREARQLVATMNQRGVVGALDGPPDASRTGVETTLGSVQAILADVKAVSAQLPELVRDLKVLTAQLPDLAGSADKLLGSGRETMGTVDDMVGATKRLWLIKDLFEPSRDDWLRAHDLGRSRR